MYFTKPSLRKFLQGLLWQEEKKMNPEESRKIEYVEISREAKQKKKQQQKKNLLSDLAVSPKY